MKKLIQRLLLFFIGLPLVVVVVLFLPQKHHLIANIIIVFLSVLGSLEFSSMLKKRGFAISNVEAGILGGACPVAMTVAVSFYDELGGMAAGPEQLLAVVLMAGFSWLLVSRVFFTRNKFEDSLNQIAAGFAVIVYPGLFMVWFIRLALFPYAEFILLTFLLLVIANDSCAWAVGMLFGRKNQGIAAASPNKSVAGFIGGFAASILVGIEAVYFIPQAFTPFRLPHPPVSGILLGLLCAAAASLGDLAESVMKRSAGIKDSGFIVPGRGGILDTLDSIALTAPVYYGLYQLLFSPL
jgi:phosphatidate cytidylyltransferase